MRRSLAFVVLALLLSVDGSVAAEPGTPLDRKALEAFVDGFVEGRMQSLRVVGVTVAVVHRDEVVLAKGYGFDDLAARRPVEAERSLFRPGSISKTLTWTAAMQLHEEGRLDLEADIRRYLPDVPIPDAFDAPITMLDLMGHRPGFEESALGHLFAGAAEDVLPLRDYLRTHQPARVRPPGTAPAYSNYGSALAGQIVANLTGLPFEDAIEKRILEPLDMARTTFREPWGAHRPGAMPEALRADVSKGYVVKGGGFASSDFEFVGHIGPAGGLSTTATDMARWLRVHLNGGALDGTRILEPETARRMHTRHAGVDPALPGIAHGFIESRLHGYRALGHGGGTVHFLSDWRIVPRLDFGVFISTNTSDGGARLIRDFARQLVARLFPPGPDYAPVPDPPEDFAERAARFTGTYVGTRRAFTTIEKIVSPLPTFRVRATDDGHLELASMAGVTRWVESAPLVFRKVDGDATIHFLEDDAGDIEAVTLPAPVQIAERVGPLADPNLRLLLLLVATLAFLGALLTAGLRRGRPMGATAGARAAASVLLAACGFYAAGLVAAIASLVPMLSDIRNAFYDFPPPLLAAALTLLLIAAAGTVLSLPLLAAVWSGSGWTVGRRVRHTALVLLALAVLFVLWDGNAIGYRYF